MNRRALLLSVLLALAACGGTTSSKPDDHESAGSAGLPAAPSAGGIMSQGGTRLPDGGKPQMTAGMYTAPGAGSPPDTNVGGEPTVAEGGAGGANAGAGGSDTSDAGAGNDAGAGPDTTGVLCNGSPCACGGTQLCDLACDG